MEPWSLDKSFRHYRSITKLVKDGENQEDRRILQWVPGQGQVQRVERTRGLRPLGDRDHPRYYLLIRILRNVIIQRNVYLSTHNDILDK